MLICLPVLNSLFAADANGEWRSFLLAILSSRFALRTQKFRFFVVEPDGYKRRALR